MEKIKLDKALEELRKVKERKFNQTVDLIVNLRGVDIRKTNVSIVVEVPHMIKEKKVCGFLTAKNDAVKTITKPEFKKYSEKNELRKLVNEYDFFIAHASLMPSVATAFGKALGPAGKMPSPQLGIIIQETPEVIKPLLAKISKSVKIRAKEASLKIPVGNISMKDEEIIANIHAIYNAIVAVLPTKKENVKNVIVKLTMSKPMRVDL